MAVAPITAKAVTWQQEVSLPVTAEYNSNLVMSSTDPRSIVLKKLIPHYKLTATQELNTWYADATLNIERSSDQTISINREDPSLNAGWKHELEKGEISLSAHYDSVSSRASELESTGQVQTVDGTRVSKSISAAWSRILNERTQFSLASAYQDVTYNGGGNNTDYSIPSVNASMSYAWNERIEPFVQYSFSRYQPSSGADVTNFQSGMLGLQWKVSERLSGSFMGGLNKSTGASNGVGRQGTATLSYLTERMNTTLRLARSVSPSGSTGGFSSSDSIGLGWSYEISEYSSSGLDFGLSKNSGTGSENRQLGGWYSHTLGEFWNMKLSFQHKQNSQAEGQGANANVLGITFVYNHPNF